MVGLNTDDEQSNIYSEYDKAATRYQRKLQAHFEYVLRTRDLLIEKLKLLIAQLSVDAIFDSIEQIFEFKMKSNEIEKTANKTQEQMSTMTNESELNQYDSLKNDIRGLKKDIKQLKLKFEEINNNSEKRITQQQQQLSISKINSQLDDPLNSIKQQINDKPMLSYLLLKPMSPSILDLNENELDLTVLENKPYLEDVAVAEFISSDTAAKINQKVHLSNNIVGLMKGPFKSVVHGTVHAAESFAKAKHASDGIVQAVNKGLAKQRQIAMKEQTTNTSFIPVFAEITSDWIYEGENVDQGFSSASIWMRDPQGQRILVKTQDLPICAANEWLAYALGRQIGLPVNKVQIAIYEKNLVTLHTDVNQGNEKTVTLLDLPRPIRKTLMSDPIIGSMDLFDHIIMNADRNPRNILITAPDTTDIEDETAKLKIHLIDHSACFGMGKLNGLSVMASKIRSRHLSVVKFDPIEQAKKFDRYLSKLWPEDRILMGNILNRFAAITNEHLDSWLTEVQDLLTSSQYNRIYSVLHRQRDIARRYTIQWGIYSKSSSTKSIKRKQLISQMSDTIAYF